MNKRVFITGVFDVVYKKSVLYSIKLPTGKTYTNHEVSPLMVICSRKSLLHAIGSRGHQPVFHFFWKGPLSQWAYSPFAVKRTVYKTAEHYMMAKKAELFNDLNMVQHIVAADTPKEAKALGQKVTGFTSRLWDRMKFKIVVTGNIAKFSQLPAFRRELEKTEDKILVEANPYDQIWGIGLSKTNKRAQDPHTWEGQNLLGFALMETRRVLKNRKVLI